MGGAFQSCQSRARWLHSSPSGIPAASLANDMLVAIPSFLSRTYTLHQHHDHGLTTTTRLCHRALQNQVRSATSDSLWCAAVATAQRYRRDWQTLSFHTYSKRTARIKSSYFRTSSFSTCDRSRVSRDLAESRSRIRDEQLGAHQPEAQVDAARFCRSVPEPLSACTRAERERASLSAFRALGVLGGSNAHCNRSSFVQSIACAL